MDIESVNLKNIKREDLLTFAKEQIARNARISFALEATEAGIWQWDTSKEEIFISSECYTLLGYKEGDQSMSFSEFIIKVHADDRAIMGTVLEDHLEAYPKTKSWSSEWLIAKGNLYG